MRWVFVLFLSSIGLSGGVLRKRYSVVVLSIVLLEVRSLIISSSFLIFGGCIEGKLVLNIDFVNKIIDEVNFFGESELWKKDGFLVVEGYIVNKEELKLYDF